MNFVYKSAFSSSFFPKSYLKVGGSVYTWVWLLNESYSTYTLFSWKIKKILNINLAQYRNNNIRHLHVMIDWRPDDNKATKQHAGYGDSFILTSGYLGQGNPLEGITFFNSKITWMKSHAI